MIFTTISSWALLSILTGVVGEGMAEAQVKMEREKADMQRAHRHERLKLFFDKVDKNGDGNLDTSELDDLLNPDHKPGCVDATELDGLGADLCDAAGMEVEICHSTSEWFFFHEFFK